MTSQALTFSKHPHRPIKPPRHDYLTEYFVEHPDYLVKAPQGLRHVGVLPEPPWVIEKGIIQAYEAQQRLKI